MKLMNLKRFNIQLFADGEEGGSDVPGAEGGANEEEETNPFDAFLKDPKNQAEFDRRISKALETQKTKLDTAHASALKKAQDEATKLAKMNADQKAEYDLEQLRKENEDLKAAQARIEMSRAATETLKGKGVEATQDILDLIVASTEEATQANIDKLVGIIEAQVKASEVTRATGRTPKSYSNEGAALTEMDKRIAKYKK